METAEKTINKDKIEQMFEAGVHYAYSKTKRHPSTRSFIFGSKNGVEIFDLEKTAVALEEAKDFLKKIKDEKKQVLFVGSKSEIREIVKQAAEKVEMPHMTNHWVGGTLTNFSEIKKRVNKYLKLIDEKEKGELAKYTKKERGKIDKEISKLENKFSGITTMKSLPAAVLVVDAKSEKIAVEEAKQKGIPVVALANSDCDIRDIDYPILANDATQESVKFILDEIISVF